jgi:hypothetical protein
MDLLVRSKIAVIESNALTSDVYFNKNLFEVYARRLLKQSDFENIHVTTGQGNFDGQGIETAKNQYFQYWHKRSGHSFWVNCEFKSNCDDKPDKLRLDQLNCHKQFQEHVWPEKVYFVIGFGGRPFKPSSMFCIPLDEVVNIGLQPKLLEKFERDPKQPFDYQNERLF